MGFRCNLSFEDAVAKALSKKRSTIHFPLKSRAKVYLYDVVRCEEHAGKGNCWRVKQTSLAANGREKLLGPHWMASDKAGRLAVDLANSQAQMIYDAGVQKP